MLFYDIYIHSSLFFVNKLGVLVSWWWVVAQVVLYRSSLWIFSLWLCGSFPGSLPPTETCAVRDVKSCHLTLTVEQEGFLRGGKCQMKCQTCIRLLHQRGDITPADTFSQPNRSHLLDRKCLEHIGTLWRFCFTALLTTTAFFPLISALISNYFGQFVKPLVFLSDWCLHQSAIFRADVGDVPSSVLCWWNCLSPTWQPLDWWWHAVKALYTLSAFFFFLVSLDISLLVLTGFCIQGIHSWRNPGAAE